MWEQSYYIVSIAASRQHGLITLPQMKHLGVDDALVDHFRSFGLIRELDWAVYQISGSSYGLRYALPYAGWLALLPNSFGWERLGTLADDVVLSHESACALLGIGSMSSTTVRFTSSKERMVPRGVRIEVSPLTPDEVMIYEGVPVATPHRVILDLVTEGASQEKISGVVTDAVLRDLVDLRMLFEDLALLAEQYGFPSRGGHFIDYFLPDVPLGPLSLRNIRAYSEIAFPDRISGVRPDIDRILATLRGEHSLGSRDVGISSEIAAEIVARVEGER
jgi:hypothetical protein